MTKKNKNIMAISIIIVLVISIIVTVCFAKDNKCRKIVNDHSFSTVDDYEINDDEIDEDDDEYEIDDDDLIISDTNITKNDEVNDGELIEEDKNIKKTKRGKGPYNNPEEFKYLEYSIRDEQAISTKYIILLCFETFLLGASVMYLIMNNIDKEINVEVKNKAKKEK